MINSTVGHSLKALIPSGLVMRTLDAPVGTKLLLTFDDGPHPAVTPKVLDRLDAFGARAVFFVVGRFIEGAPDLLSVIEQRGHLLGNHTFQHRNDRDPSFFAYMQDLRRCQSLVAAHATAPRLFRPPKGHLSFTSLTASRLLGLRVIHWSLNVRDWACKTRDEALAAAEQFDQQVAPGQIVLLHDDNPCVLDLLDYVLPRLRDRGFDLASGVEELRAS